MLLPAKNLHVLIFWLSIHFSSVTQPCPILCDPTDCSTPGFPVYHQLLGLTQTQVHQSGDAIQPSHRLSFLSSPAFYLSQHQGLFQRVSHPFDGNLLILQDLILDDFLHETFSVPFMHFLFLFLLSFPNSLWKLLYLLYIAVIILHWIHFKLPRNLWIPWAQGLCPNIFCMLSTDLRFWYIIKDQ